MTFSLVDFHKFVQKKYILFWRWRTVHDICEIKQYLNCGGVEMMMWLESQVATKN
jgi:hypothetical protein